MRRRLLCPQWVRHHFHSFNWAPGTILGYVASNTGMDDYDRAAYLEDGMDPDDPSVIAAQPRCGRCNRGYIVCVTAHTTASDYGVESAVYGFAFNTVSRSGEDLRDATPLLLGGTRSGHVRRSAPFDAGSGSDTEPPLREAHLNVFRSRDSHRDAPVWVTPSTIMDSMGVQGDDIVRGSHSGGSQDYTGLVGSMSSTHTSDRIPVSNWSANLTGHARDTGCVPGQ